MYHISQGLMGAIILLLVVTVGHTAPATYTLRFSDTSARQEAVTSQDGPGVPTSVTGPEAPTVEANKWLKRNGWKQVWPLKLFSGSPPLVFAGPSTRRYLRLQADNTYYIWAREIDIDPSTLPMLAITWGVERFPQQAALDVYKRNDRAIVVLVSFGPKVPSSGVLPDVPRALAFFWGENDAVGKNYTCIQPRVGPADERMQCNYPHVKYIALRQGEEGSTHTDTVNLLDMFHQHFPEHQQQRVLPITGVSFEARSDLTKSTSSARLYSLRFAAPGGTTAPVSSSTR